MTLIARFTKLFHADMHAVLDAIEEPELLLKQSIRDMEEILSKDEKHVQLLSYEQQQLLAKQLELEQSLIEVDEKLALCFQANKDDFARSLLKRKLELQQSQKAIAAKQAETKEKITRLSAQLKEHQSQLASMKQKADIFLTKPSAVNWESPQTAICDEDVEVAFLYEKQKWGQS
jgi:phage shock protein A